jgi:hypothetical protein
MAKRKSYEVQAILKLMITVSVDATSLEDAVARSKEMEETDFVDMHGDYIDGNMRISGVYESYCDL